MKFLKRLTLALSLTFALGTFGFAGETNAPPCSNNPGEVNAPPCSSAQYTSDGSNDGSTLYDLEQATIETAISAIREAAIF